MSRRHKQYIVYQMIFSSFFVLTNLKNQLIANRNKDVAGETINGMKIHNESGVIPAEVQHWYMNLSVETDPASEYAVDN